MRSSGSVAEPIKKPHTLFVRPDCNFCGLFVQSMRGTDLEHMVSVVDVTQSRVDPRQIYSVPTIFADNRAAYSGRDAFVWLVEELKRTILPAHWAGDGGLSAAYLDGTDLVGQRQMSSVNFVEPETRRDLTEVAGESVETRLARMKQERSEYA